MTNWQLIKTPTEIPAYLEPQKSVRMLTENTKNRISLSAHFQIAGFCDIISAKVNSEIISKLYFLAWSPKQNKILYSHSLNSHFASWFNTYMSIAKANIFLQVFGQYTVGSIEDLGILSFLFKMDINRMF